MSTARWPSAWRTGGAPLVICGFITSPAVAAMLFAILGAGNAMIDTGYYSVMQRAITASSLARVLGVVEALFHSGIAVGAFAGAVLVDHVGSRVAIATVGLMLPVVATMASRRLSGFDGDLNRRNHKIARLKRLPTFARLPMSTLDHMTRGRPGAPTTPPT